MSIFDVMLTSLYMFTLYYTIFWLLVFVDIKPEKNKKISIYPKVTVVIPCYNDSHSVGKSAISVLNLNYPKNKIELIIVNDGSTDNSKNVLKRLKKEYNNRNISIMNQSNHGKWRALNKGLDLANGEYFVCLDADSVVEANALIKLLPNFRAKRIAAVLPVLKINSPKNFLQKLQWYEYVINIFYKKLIGILDCIHVVPGPFSVYRTAILRKVGGFKEGYHTEDLEIALRLQAADYKIIQCLDGEVYTESPSTIKGLWIQRIRWNRGSILNTWAYKNMLFNIKYGDFGMFQLPIVLFYGFIAISIVVLTMYLTVFKPLWKTIFNMSFVNFDFLTFIKTYRTNVNLLDLSYYNIVILFVVLIISSMVIVLSHRYLREKITKHNPISLVIFVFLYYIFLGIIWVNIIKDLIFTKRNVKW